MRFERLDLNLLVALQALLTERSVSLAADRICLSQSATSSALSRLRDYFGDELLVLKGRQMVLTARAEALVEPVNAVLDQVRTTIAVSPPFDPATSERCIRIIASDYMIEVLLASMLTELKEEAPEMRFELLPMTDGVLEALDRGFIDLLMTIDYAMSSDHPSHILFEDDYVVVGWEGNPAMQRPMTKELYFELAHVAACFGRNRVPAFEEWFVRRQKRARRVEVTIPSFTGLPSLVIGSKRIATMHRRLATKLANNLPIIIRDVPLEIPKIREAVQWHISNNNDPAIRWIVEKLVVAARQPSVGDAKIIPLERAKPKELSQDELAAQFLSQVSPKLSN